MKTPYALMAPEQKQARADERKAEITATAAELRDAIDKANMAIFKLAKSGFSVDLEERPVRTNGDRGMAKRTTAIGLKNIGAVHRDPKTGNYTVINL